MPMQSQPLVKGFAGEDRLRADELLPDHIAVDGQNMDYRTGTLAQRAGFQRLHTTAVKWGGFYVRNVATAKCGYLPAHAALNLVGDFTVEFTIRFHSSPTGTVRIMTNENGTTGWIVYTNTAFRFNIEYRDSGGTGRTATTPNTAGNLALAGVTHHVAFVRSGTTMTAYANGNAGTPVTCSGESPSTRNVYIGAGGGATPSNQTCEFTIDELRVWDEARTTDQLAAGRGRELTDSEIADTSHLKAYYKFNDAPWYILTDSSSTGNHGAVYDSGPSAVAGLIPYQGEEGYALRFDGIDDWASILFAAQWTDLTVIKTWSVEAWVRLDRANTGATSHVLSLGISTEKRIFRVYIDTDNSLKYSHSTETTDTDVVTDTTYDAVVGTAFHLALVRNDTSIFTYINGVLFHTKTGVASEVNPTTVLDSVSGYFNVGASRGASAAFSLFGAITVDDVRLWSSARTSHEITNWYQRRFVDVKRSDLLAYWRFDARDLQRNEKRDEAWGSSDVATKGTTLTSPNDTYFVRWAQGLVYPVAPQRTLLAAPLYRPYGSDEAREGKTLFDRRYLLINRSTIFELFEDNIRQLGDFDDSSQDTLWDWAHFQDYLVLCNGIRPNLKFRGDQNPKHLSYTAPTAPTVAAVAGGSLGGETVATYYGYKIAWYDPTDDTESIASDPVTVTIPAEVTANQTAELTIPVQGYRSTTHVKVYRTEMQFSTADVDTATYYPLYDGSNPKLVGVKFSGTTVFNDTGSYTLNTSSALNIYKGFAPSCKCVASHANRLFLANSADYPSGLFYSEANTEEDFTATNVILVSPGDGDEITGLVSAFDGLIVFKQRAIYFLTGHDEASFYVRKVVSGYGAVNAQTIAESPTGIYFLGESGVYRMDSAFNVTNVGRSQEEIFRNIYDPDRRMSVATYDPAQQRYYVSLRYWLNRVHSVSAVYMVGGLTTQTLTSRRVTMVYDERADAWSLWTLPFDTLETVIVGENASEVVGSMNGFLCKLGASTTDGYSFTATPASSPDGVAYIYTAPGFTTTDDGLRGLILRGSNSERLIVGNSDTTLYTVPLTGGIFSSVQPTYIGYIDSFWRSRWMDMGDPATVKRFYYLLGYWVENMEPFAIKYQTELEGWATITPTNGDVWEKMLASTRGRKIQLEFQWRLSSGEVTGWELMLAVKGAR